VLEFQQQGWRQLEKSGVSRSLNRRNPVSVQSNHSKKKKKKNGAHDEISGLKFPARKKNGSRVVGHELGKLTETELTFS